MSKETIKMILINILLPIIGLVLAITLLIYVTKMEEPRVLEGDLIDQCKEVNGEYLVFQFDNKISASCKIPTEYLFQEIFR